MQIARNKKATKSTQVHDHCLRCINCLCNSLAYQYSLTICSINFPFSWFHVEWIYCCSSSMGTGMPRPRPRPATTVGSDIVKTINRRHLLHATMTYERPYPLLFLICSWRVLCKKKFAFWRYRQRLVVLQYRRQSQCVLTSCCVTNPHLCMSRYQEDGRNPTFWEKLQIYIKYKFSVFSVVLQWTHRLQQLAHSTIDVHPWL